MFIHDSVLAWRVILLLRKSIDFIWAHIAQPMAARHVRHHQFRIIYFVDIFRVSGEHKNQLVKCHLTDHRSPITNQFSLDHTLCTLRRPLMVWHCNRRAHTLEKKKKKQLSIRVKFRCLRLHS